MPRSKLPWFKFCPQDWVDSTRHLTLEERGMQIDLICLQYVFEAPVKDDYKWLGHQLHITPRKAEKLVRSLISENKIRQVPEGLVNDRVSDDIKSRAIQSQVNTANGKNRYQKHSENFQNSVENPENNNNINKPSSISLTENSIEKERELEKESDETYTNFLSRTDSGFDLYNDAAMASGFASCQLRSADRRNLLDQRICNIGGIENFRKALSAVTHDPFLSGKSTANTEQPFRLTIDFLLRTDSKLGDVLTRLVELEELKNRPSLSDKIFAMSDDEQEKLVKQHANGRWPFDKLFMPPGTTSCVIRPAVLKRCGIDMDTYNIAGVLQ